MLGYTFSVGCDSCAEGSTLPDGFAGALVVHQNGSVTTTEAECKVPPKCEAGHYSSTGIKPCTQCARGLLQNREGQNTCEQVPASTSLEGAHFTKAFSPLMPSGCRQPRVSPK